MLQMSAPLHPFVSSTSLGQSIFALTFSYFRLMSNILRLPSFPGRGMSTVSYRVHILF